MSYWATAVTEALVARLEEASAGQKEIQGGKEGNILRQIFPTLNDGLAMRDCPEMRIACLAIIVTLVARVELEADAATALMEAILNGSVTKTSLSAPELTCIALVAESSKLTELPKRVFIAITTQKTAYEVTSELADLSSVCQVDSLTLGLLAAYKNKSTSSSKASCLKFLQGALEKNLLDVPRLESAFKIVFPSAKDREEDLDQIDALGSFLAQIEQTAQIKGKLVAASFSANLPLKVLRDSSVISPSSDGASDGDDRMDLGIPPRSNRKLQQSEWDFMAADIPYGSFLASPRPPLFDILLQHLNMDTNASLNLDDFQAVGAFSNQKVESELPFFTFCLRASLSNLGQTPRIAALNHLREFIRRREFKKHVPIVLPYLLCALCDLSTLVRKAAWELVLALEELYTKLDKLIGKNEDIELLGQDWANAQGSESKWLTIGDVKVFLSEALIPNMEESMQDPAYISQLVGRVLNKSTGDGKMKTLKTSLRSRIFAFLCQSAVISPLYTVKVTLLKMLDRVKENKHISRMQHLRPLLNAVESLGEPELQKFCLQDGIHPEELLSEVATIITPKNAEGLFILEKLLTESSSNHMLRSAALRRIGAIWTPLPQDVKKTIAILLFQTALDAPQEPSPSFRMEASAALIGLEHNAETLFALLDVTPKLMTAEREEPLSKKRKTSTKAKDTSHMTHEATWLKLATVLNLISNFEAGKDVSLLPKLFDRLDDIVQYNNQHGMSNAFEQSVFLDTLRRSVDHLATAQKPETMIKTAQVDLVVDYLQGAPGTQVRQSAFMLLSSIATAVPTAIVHSVMPIFTLMGTTVMKQSDEHSMNVVRETITSVVPPLLSAFRKARSGPLQDITELVSGFVTALEHIPQFQRLAVLNVLVDTLGAGEFLFIVLVLITDQYENDEAMADLALQLLVTQKSLVQLQTIKQCLDAVDSMVGQRDKRDFWISSFLHRKDWSRLCVELTALLSKTLKHPRAKRRAAGTVAVNDEAAMALRQHFGEALERTLLLLDAAEYGETVSYVFEEFARSLAAFWPSDEAFRMLILMLEHNDSDVQHRILKVLQHQISQTKPGDTDLVQKACIGCLERLSSFVGGPGEVSAILCIDKIAENFGRASPDQFLHLPEVFLERSTADAEKSQRSAVALICLSTLVDVLREDFAAYAPRTLARALDLLEVKVKSEQSKSEISHAAYSLLNTILNLIPWSVAGANLDRLLLVSSMPLEPEVADQVYSIKSEVLTSVAKEIEPVECLSSLHRTLRDATQRGGDAFKTYIEAIRKIVDGHPKSVIAANAKELMAIFLEALDTRALRDGALTELRLNEAEYAQLETSIYDVMIKMIYKLNDTHFRPLFIKGCAWMQAPNANAVAQGAVFRAVAWFGFLQDFFGTLKSIVTNYATFVTDSAAALLKAADYRNKTSVLLSARILATLTACFAHDQDDFWQAHDAFETISAPLLLQLPLTAASKSAAHLSEPLNACIAAFATASGSAEHRRTINMAILPHLRADEVALRLAAAKCQRAITKEVGGDWLVMLPEMLPFMAEALEDDDERVEREVRAWVKDIEAERGESLDAMLQ